MAVTIGIDIGQKRDHSAICVVEDENRGDYHFFVRHLERLPLGTAYPAIAGRVAEVMDGVKLQAHRWALIYVNVTGFGDPMIDLVRTYVPGATVRGVVFNHGDLRSSEGGRIILGKAFLVTRLQILLQLKRLHLRRGPDTQLLAQELLEYDIKVEPDANDKYGAFRVGTQDDLVTALGLTVQVDPARWGATGIDL